MRLAHPPRKQLHTHLQRDDNGKSPTVCGHDDLFPSQPFSDSLFGPDASENLGKSAKSLVRDTLGLHSQTWNRTQPEPLGSLHLAPRLVTPRPPQRGLSSQAIVCSLL